MQGKRRDILADQDQPRRNDAADASEEIGRRAIIDRHDDHAGQQTAPERHDPLGPVLAPDDGVVALAQSHLVHARGECPRGATHLCVRVSARAEPIVVNKKFAARLREVPEKVNQRIAGHG